MVIRIGTRGSDLALWQAHHIADAISDLTGETPEIRVIKTSGDRIQDVPLTADLGRSFFTKEIEDALLAGEVDIAVHSLKDLAVEQPEGLTLAAVTERASASERLLVRPGVADPSQPELPLPQGARVGTSSPRRRRRLHELRGDLQMQELRGNVPTRVDKLRKGDYDAILLAAAGLDRLGLDLSDLECFDLPVTQLPGAPAQGALGVQARAGDDAVLDVMRRLEDPGAEATSRCERLLLRELGGGCNLPLGTHCRRLEDGDFHLFAFLFPEAPGSSLEFDGRGDTPESLASQASVRLRPALTRPLEGRNVVLFGSDETPRLYHELCAAGAHAEHVACFRAVDVEPGSDDLGWIGASDCVMFASRRAVDRLVALIESSQTALSDGALLLVPGASTRKHVLRAFPGHDVEIGDPPRSEGMGRRAVAAGATRVALLGAVGGNTEGLRIVSDAGIPGRQVAVYENRARDEQPTAIGDAVPIYLAPAAVRNIPPEQLGAARVIAIGPTTGAALEGRVPFVVAERPDLTGILSLLEPTS